MKFLRSALVVAAAALLPLVPSAAHADKYVYADPSGDVLKLVDPQVGTTEPAPGRVEGDIVRSSVRHKARRVLVTMRFQELTREGIGQLFGYGIRTAKMTRYVTVDTGPGHWGGKVTVTKPNGKKVRCNVTRTIDYASNTAAVSVPRACIGKPRWVKASMREGSFVSESEIYFDDALISGKLTRYPVWSPRVRR